MISIISRRTAALATMAVGLFFLSSCATEAESSQLHFARISADVVVAGDGAASANLVVAAPSDDPIWSGISELVAKNDHTDGGDLVFGEGAVRLIPGGEQDGTRLGTIVVEMPLSVDNFSMSEIVITLAGDHGPENYNVGEWNFERIRADGIVEISGEYPASVSECNSVSFDVQGDLPFEIDGVSSRGAGVDILDVDIGVAKGTSRTVVLDLACDPQFDLYAFTPLIDVTSEGKKGIEPLQPILIGYAGITDEVVNRILTRR
ncbi:hypothetical protein LC082_12180 [Microbacterium esteraromaticum]|uniref:hypothetical protein n=1 Tax=Microbacterium esteraromaticum TaxID=57043 RepID=UPI001CD7022E|nr:hypothetical protein [Microbacterium esteraromaticum]MCA1307658.1 hypothetical protein [Microbacterium esteraromaticum]